MDKSYLEKVVEERAKKRLDDAVLNFKRLVINDPIGCSFGIKIDDKPAPGGMKPRYMPIACSGNRWTLIDSASDGPENNLETIKTELLEKYKKEELDNILNKLDGIRYLFEQA